MEFRSKIDWWLAALIAVALIAAPVTILLGNSTASPSSAHPLLLAVGTILPIVLIVRIYASTRYVVNGADLRILGGVTRKTIPIASIRRISASRNVMAAPALSLDRLEIAYGKYDVVLISPKEKRDFIRSLLAVAPGIQLVGLDKFR